MRCLGKLLVVWGVVVPLMTYPWASGFNPQSGLLASLPHMYLHVFGTEFSYAVVVALGLWAAGLGLTANALVEDVLWERLLRAAERLSELEK